MGQQVDVRALKESYPVVDVLDRLGISVRRGSRAHCPFCISSTNRKDPTLDYGRQWWKCYRCEAKGDVLTLVQKVLNIDFIGAVKFLTADLSSGATVPQSRASSQVRPMALAAPLTFNAFVRDGMRDECQHWDAMNSGIIHRRETRIAQATAQQKMGFISPIHAGMERSQAEEVADREFDDLDAEHLVESFSWRELGG